MGGKLSKRKRGYNVNNPKWHKEDFSVVHIEKQTGQAPDSAPQSQPKPVQTETPNNATELKPAVKNENMKQEVTIVPVEVFLESVSPLEVMENPIPEQPSEPKHIMEPKVPVLEEETGAVRKEQHQANSPVSFESQDSPEYSESPDSHVNLTTPQGEYPEALNAKPEDVVIGDGETVVDEPLPHDVNYVEGNTILNIGNVFEPDPYTDLQDEYKVRTEAPKHPTEIPPPMLRDNAPFIPNSNHEMVSRINKPPELWMTEAEMKQDASESLGLPFLETGTSAISQPEEETLHESPSDLIELSSSEEIAEEMIQETMPDNSKVLMAPYSGEGVNEDNPSTDKEVEPENGECDTRHVLAFLPSTEETGDSTYEPLLCLDHCNSPKPVCESDIKNNLSPGMPEVTGLTTDQLLDSSEGESTGELFVS